MNTLSRIWNAALLAAALGGAAGAAVAGQDLQAVGPVGNIGSGGMSAESPSLAAETATVAGETSATLGDARSPMGTSVALEGSSPVDTTTMGAGAADTRSIDASATGPVRRNGGELAAPAAGPAPRADRN